MSKAFIKYLFFAGISLNLGCNQPSNSRINADQSPLQGVFGGRPLDENLDFISKAVVYVPFGSSGSCSGFFISHDIVLTAAHCITRPPSRPSLVSIVRLGQTKNIPIKMITVHPNFKDSAEGKEFDVAVIQLQQLEADSVSIPILSYEKWNLFGDTVVVAGAGTTNPAKPVYNGYNIATVRVHSEDGNFLVLDQTLGAGACAGDSGAPVFVKTPSHENVLVALIQGPYKTTPTVCTQLGQAIILHKVMNFILETIRSNGGEEPFLY